MLQQTKYVVLPYNGSPFLNRRYIGSPYLNRRHIGSPLFFGRLHSSLCSVSKMIQFLPTTSKTRGTDPNKYNAQIEQDVKHVTRSH